MTYKSQISVDSHMDHASQCEKEDDIKMVSFEASFLMLFEHFQSPESKLGEILELTPFSMKYIFQCFFKEASHDFILNNFPLGLFIRVLRERIDKGLEAEQDVNVLGGCLYIFKKIHPFIPCSIFLPIDAFHSILQSIISYSNPMLIENASLLLFQFLSSIRFPYEPIVEHITILYSANHVQIQAACLQYLTQQDLIQPDHFMFFLDMILDCYCPEVDNIILLFLASMQSLTGNPQIATAFLQTRSLCLEGQPIVDVARIAFQFSDIEAILNECDIPSQIEYIWHEYVMGNDLLNNEKDCLTQLLLFYLSKNSSEVQQLFPQRDYLIKATADRIKEDPDNNMFLIPVFAISIREQASEMICAQINALNVVDSIPKEHISGLYHLIKAKCDTHPFASYLFNPEYLDLVVAFRDLLDTFDPDIILDNIDEEVISVTDEIFESAAQSANACE